MFHRILLPTIAAGVACFALAPISAAQNPNCPLKFTDVWPYPDGYPPGWFYYSGYAGTFVVYAAAHVAAPGCAPCESQCPAGAGPGGSGSSSSSSAGSAGSGSPSGSSAPSGSPESPSGGWPIYLCTGDTFIAETDVSLPGLGGGLSLRRQWNSVWPSNQIASSVGIFGPNWKSTYEERIFMGSDNWLKYARANGDYWSFGLTPDGGMEQFVVASPSTASATLVLGPSYWTLTFQNGERRRFDIQSGLLTAIIDRNGNATQVGYDSSGRLASITDPVSRHLYFNYTGSGLLVTSVTSDFGVTFSYSYDGSGRLTQVTRPDQTTISYNYNSQSLITSVTDQNGKVLESHTYDSNNRGLTSSRANGVEVLSIVYPQ